MNPVRLIALKTFTALTFALALLSPHSSRAQVHTHLPSPTLGMSRPLTCTDVYMLEPTKNGADDQLVSRPLHVEISPALEGENGWVARGADHKGQRFYSVNVRVEPLAAEELSELADIIPEFLPSLNWSDVASARMGGVSFGKRSLDDEENGIAVIELLGAQGEVLGKLIVSGWGLGVCRG